jgi:hypothetical protein
MKHLSRVLSLALVIALSLSLVVVAGAKNVGDYPDKDEIAPEYMEAVDVLTALGIFQGDENGSLYPKNTFTRAQAAKIVTYVAIGTSAADKLAHRVSSFSDVATDHWANPFIEYAVEKGIVNGVGGGLFAPDNAVTGSQLSKMLLVALGYGAKGEYVGSSWEINAIVDGQARGILTASADFSAPAKREEAIQYTFNTIRPNGQNAAGTPLGKNFLVKYTALIDDYILANSTTFQTGTAQYIGTEVFHVFTEADQDDSGFDGHFWRVGAKRISETFYKDGVILGEFATNATVSQGYLYSSYEWNDDLASTARANDIEYWINGVSQGYVPVSSFAVKNSTIFAAFPAGYYVTLVDMTSEGEYGPDGKVDKVVATFGSLAKVATVNALTGTIVADRYFVNGSTKTYSKVLVEATGYAVGDYIVITPIGEFIASATVPTDTISIEKANIVTAKATSYTTDSAGFSGVGVGLINSITANGVTYYVAKTEALTYSTDISFENDIVFYLDSHNSVVGYDGSTVTAASLNYLYIRGLSTGFSDSNGFADHRASVTYSDGTYGIVTLAFNSNGTALAGNNAPTLSVSWESTLEHEWFSYTVNSNSEVVISSLRAATSAIQGSNKVTLSAAPAALKYTTGGTISGYATSTTVLKINGGTYTGYSRFPAREFTDGQILVVYAEQSGVPTSTIAAIYIITDSPVDSGEYGVVFARTSVTGGKSQYMVKTAKAVAEGTIYEMGLLDETGTLTNYPMGTVVEIVTASNGTRSVGGLSGLSVVTGTITEVDPTYIVLDGTALYYTSTGTAFFDLAGIETAVEWLEGDYVAVYGGTQSNSTNPPPVIVKTDSLTTAKDRISSAISGAESYKTTLTARSSGFSFDTALADAKTAAAANSVVTIVTATTALDDAITSYKAGLAAVKTAVVTSTSTEYTTIKATNSTAKATVENSIRTALDASGAGYLGSAAFTWEGDDKTVNIVCADGSTVQWALDNTHS